MKTLVNFIEPILFLIYLTDCNTDTSDVQEIKTANLTSNEFAQAQAQIAYTLDEIFLSIQNKDVDRLASFHLSDSKFTEFQNGGFRTGAAENKAAERALLESISSFDYDLNDLKIDVFYNNVAKATFHADFRPTINGQQFQQVAQVTLMFVRVGNGWKIGHEHLSPLSVPSSSGAIS